MNFDDYEKTGRARYARLAQVVEDILQHALRRAEIVANHPQTQPRAKDPVRLKQKLRERGILDSATIENEIKDLAGCRIIFYTETDLERFRNSAFWRETFEVDWQASKTHFPRSERASVDELYQGIHFVVQLNAERIKLVEYADLAGLKCEVQLQTILNHAWSETSHDVLYKGRRAEGFGTRQFEALKQRFARVMRDHLMPAGYEMQKIQEDAERFHTGLAVFDSAPLKKLSEARDNNQRVDTIVQIKTHLLPGLDDLSFHIREIRAAMVSAIEAARTVPVVARNGIMGSMRGATSTDVLKSGLEVLDSIRYSDMDEGFQALVRLWTGTTGRADCEPIEASLERLAKFSIPVWEQVGAGVQLDLLDALSDMSADRRKIVRPLVLVVCRAALSAEMDHSEMTSFDAVTLSRASVSAHETLVTARGVAIALGIEALEAATSRQEWDAAWRCLWSGTGGVISGDTDRSVSALQWQLMRDLCAVVARHRTNIPYDILQEVEEDLYWAYRNLGGSKEDIAADIGANAEATSTRAALEACRDQLNLDDQYIAYKTLVGFRTVFVEEWNQDIDVTDRERQREERIERYAALVTRGNADYWRGVAVQCAETESDDLATFPPLTKFFKVLALRQPRIALDILLAGGKPLEGFAPAFIPTLLRTEARAATLTIIETWLSSGRNAAALGRALFLSDEPFADLIAQGSTEVVAKRDIASCVEFAHAALKHGDERNQLWSAPLCSALAVLNDAGNGAFASSYLMDKQLSAKLAWLAEPAVKIVLDNFVRCSEIGYGQQKKLSHLIERHGEQVWGMFEARLRYAQGKSWEERYQAVPEHWHGLEKALRSDIRSVLKRVRGWAEAEGSWARWHKAKFLANLYHDCDQSFVNGMVEAVRAEGADLVPFISDVLKEFGGDERIYPICRAMVEVLPEDDDAVLPVHRAIEATGFTTGEFGRVEALGKKAVLLKPWLDDPSPKVQRFARALIADLDKMVIEERRRATARQQQRKRDFDDAA
jgi:ppGpp synthetase/RelA/SpoT-type nucleotidyltranferase